MSLDWERFKAKMDISAGPNGCWEWAGRRKSDGYGQFHASGKTIKAHRWLVEHIIGFALEPDEYVTHDCDNSGCVNPRHLSVGDAQSNMREMSERGRGRNGNEAKTHCPNGHPYDETNTRVYSGGRYCRTCNRERARRNRREARNR